MVNGEAVDVGSLCTLASTTVRISARLGLERVPKDVTPTLAEYLSSRDAEQPENAVDEVIDR
jgi:hypothetical protein